MLSGALTLLNELDVTTSSKAEMRSRHTHRVLVLALVEVAGLLRAILALVKVTTAIFDALLQRSGMRMTPTEVTPRKAGWCGNRLLLQIELLFDIEVQNSD